MTTAICIHCGTSKRGAWTACPNCKYVPKGKIEQAQSVLLSDHHLSQTELNMISNRIKIGEAIEYDQQELAEITAMLDSDPADTLKIPIGYDIRLWLVVLFLLIGLLFVIGWIWY